MVARPVSRDQIKRSCSSFVFLFLFFSPTETATCAWLHALLMRCRTSLLAVTSRILSKIRALSSYATRSTVPAHTPRGVVVSFAVLQEDGF